MKQLGLIVCLALCSCAWLKTNDKALSADAIATVSCVVNAALAGQPVEEIGCGVSAVEDIVTILDASHVTPVASPALAAVRAAQSSNSAATAK